MTMPDDHHPDDLLDAWLDDRLSAEERHRVDEHLAACERCRRQLAVLRATVETVRSGLPSPPPPSGLAARIGAVLDAEDARHENAMAEVTPIEEARATPPPRLPRRRSPLRWVAAAAAALTAVAAIAYWLGAPGPGPAPGPQPGPSHAADLVDEFDAAYAELDRDPLPASLETADPAEVESRWQSAGLGFPSRVFDLEAMNIHLAGGGAALVGGRQTAVTAYRSDAGLLVCWMFEGKASQLPDDVEVRHHNGFDFHVYRRGDRTLVFWQEGDVLCALAGRGDPETVIALAIAKAMAPEARRAA